MKQSYSKPSSLRIFLQHNFQWNIFLFTLFYRISMKLQKEAIESLFEYEFPRR